MSKYLRPFQLVLLSLILAVPAAAQVPNAITGPNMIFSPYNFWPDPRMGRFYNSGAIVIGANFFFYLQGGVTNNVNGGPGDDCPTSNEQILIFETPYTHDNIRSAAYGPPLYCTGCSHPAQGPWTYKGHASPCRSAPMHHYNLGDVFQSSWDGQYKMLVDETDNGADWGSGDFKRTLLLTSSDGINWASQQNPLGGGTPPFLAQSTVGGQVLSIGQVFIVQGASEWWGTFSFGTALDSLLGRIRVFKSSSDVRGFVAYIWSSDSQWHAVNDDGTFNYAPADTNPAITLNKVKLVNHQGQYEAWGGPDYFTPTQPLDPKDPGCNDGGSSRGAILRATIQEGIADTMTAPPALGTPVYITSSLDTRSDHTQNWPLATQDDVGRLYPWRFDDGWGKYLVYSSNLDAVCWAGLIVPGTWRGMGVVLTVVDQ